MSEHRSTVTIWTDADGVHVDLDILEDDREAITGVMALLVVDMEDLDIPQSAIN